MTASLKEFMELTGQELDAESQKVFDLMMSSMSNSGIKGDFKLELSVDFKDDKTLLAMSGESLDDLVDQMLGSFDADDFNVTETKETQYKIEDNKVKMTGEDALGYFVYDEAKGGLVIGTDDTSDQSKNMVKLLSGIVLKKK